MRAGAIPCPSYQPRQKPSFSRVFKTYVEPYSMGVSNLRGWEYPSTSMGCNGFINRYGALSLCGFEKWSAPCFAGFLSARFILPLGKRLVKGWTQSHTKPYKLLKNQLLDRSFAHSSGLFSTQWIQMVPSSASKLYTSWLINNITQLYMGYSSVNVCHSLVILGCASKYPHFCGMICNDMQCIYGSQS